MSDIYTLRFQVYCKERNFLRAEAYPDNQEWDKFDRYSLNFAAFNRRNEVVGAVRLVRPPTGKPFPFQEHCPVFEGVELPPHDCAAEISRLVVSQHYRQPRDETIIGFSPTLMDRQGRVPDDIQYCTVERRTPSLRIVMGLYWKMYRYSKKAGVTHWYAAMEKSLARMLMRYDFAFHPIGPEVDYYGPVTPYLANIAELEASLTSKRPELMAWFQNKHAPVEKDPV